MSISIHIPFYNPNPEKKEGYRNLTRFDYLTENVLGLKKIRNVFALEMSTNEKFNFLCNDIMRHFDLFRKTLNQQEMQKDIRRFSNLSSLEIEYYLIWGYPYLFEFNNHHISVSDIKKEIIFDNSIKSLNYSNISLMRQDSLNSKFISICKSD